MNPVTCQEKTCTNCRHYRQHYIKQNTRFCTTDSGHCTKQLYKSRKKENPPEACGLWEDMAVKKEERKKAIREVLVSISRQLDEIVMVLKDDFE